jgi:hypothetical protein
MFNDLEKTIDLINTKRAAPNFLLALVICCYIEYWGRLVGIAKNDSENWWCSSDAIVNCPFVYWHGGSLKERIDKTLSDQMAYGGAQVLNTHIKKMQVTFVGHRGFAPDGSTISFRERIAKREEHSCYLQ